MKDSFSVIGIGLFAIIAVVGVTWVAQGDQFFLYKVFAPLNESVRRDTMLQSRAYSEATARELFRLKIQYEEAKTDDERQTIKAMVRQEYGAIDIHLLPSELQAFVVSSR